jgi:acetone carboxylase gamma subunit
MSSDSSRVEYELVKSVKEAHERELLAKQNVVGCGVGYKFVDGKRTDKLAIVVMVRKKTPEGLLELEEIIPGEIDGVPVDVQEVGELRVFK